MEFSLGGMDRDVGDEEDITFGLILLHEINNNSIIRGQALTIAQQVNVNIAFNQLFAIKTLQPNDISTSHQSRHHYLISPTLPIHYNYQSIMSQSYPRKKSIFQKAQPVPSILQISRHNNHQLQQNTPLTFKNQMLSKLHLDQCFQFKIDPQCTNENKNTENVGQRKRISNEIRIKKKFCLPEIENTKKQDQFKYEFRQLKLQSKRMLDRVNQLYEILKSDQGKQSVKGFRIGRTLSKVENLNPEQGSITMRKRNKTLGSKELKSVELPPSTIDIMNRKSSKALYTKRRYSDRRTTESSPQSGLMFTFYPKPEQINEFMQ